MDDTSTTAEAMEAHALRAAELRDDGPAGVPAMPDGASRKPRSPAEWAFMRVVLYLRSFEEALGETEEAAMGFAGGPGGVMRIKGVGFNAPDLVTFTGTDATGAKVQLIQHVSQLNVALRAVSRPSDRPAERIGFRLARALESQEEAEAATQA